MSVIRSLCSAFLMYSRIPVPKVEWKEENRRYALCFFPLVGAVIGAVLLLWYHIAEYFSAGKMLFAVICTALPVMITGGIHLDGFCDVNDALASCSDRQKMLEIMKDSHIGAFAVIRLCIYLMLQAGIYSEISCFAEMLIIALISVQSRSWSALAAVTLPNARGEGSLAVFSEPAHKRITVAAEIIYLMISSAAMIWCGGISGAAAVICGAIVFLYYRYTSLKRFGGITGDTAGYFLQLFELITAAAVIAADKLLTGVIL
ncbi:MAG: adenosylcobinamide-GDP ribazoletransferase [Oscillospiraceae bacterium]